VWRPIAGASPTGRADLGRGSGLVRRQLVMTAVPSLRQPASAFQADYLHLVGSRVSKKRALMAPRCVAHNDDAQNTRRRVPVVKERRHLQSGDDLGGPQPAAKGDIPGGAGGGLINRIASPHLARQGGSGADPSGVQPHGGDRLCAPSISPRSRCSTRKPLPAWPPPPCAGHHGRRGDRGDQRPDPRCTGHWMC
jgi:hypothetical protein